MNINIKKIIILILVIIFYLPNVVRENKNLN